MTRIAIKALIALYKMPIPVETYRPFCDQCLRPGVTCVCSEIKPFTPSIQFVILRHHRERKRTIGTAQMAHLCLKGSRIFNGKEFESHPGVKALVENPDQDCFLLFPGPTSVNIEHEVPVPIANRFTSQRKVLIFVIDGTWGEARQILRRTPVLAAISRISFSLGKLSEYGFRKQPEPHCLSTIESIHRVLEILEPKTNADNLLHVFRTMVKAQLEFARLESIRITESTSRRGKKSELSPRALEDLR